MCDVLPKKKAKYFMGSGGETFGEPQVKLLPWAEKPLRTLRGITCPHSREPLRPAEKRLSSISIKSEPFLQGAEMFQMLIRDQENQMTSGRGGGGWKTLGAKCLFSCVRTEPCLVRLRMCMLVMASGMMKPTPTPPPPPDPRSGPRPPLTKRNFVTDKT